MTGSVVIHQYPFYVDIPILRFDTNNAVLIVFIYPQHTHYIILYFLKFINSFSSNIHQETFSTLLVSDSIIGYLIIFIEDIVGF
jgi:hypothetical protein